MVVCPPIAKRFCYFDDEFLKKKSRKYGLDCFSLPKPAALFDSVVQSPLHLAQRAIVHMSAQAAQGKSLLRSFSILMSSVLLASKSGVCVELCRLKVYCF